MESKSYYLVAVGNQSTSNEYKCASAEVHDISLYLLAISIDYFIEEISQQPATIYP